MVADITRDISVKLLQIWTGGLEGVVKRFSFFKILAAKVAARIKEKRKSFQWH